MRFSEFKVESIPFPKEGFQKYDIITPKDPEEYGKEYEVIDYKKGVNIETAKVEYIYVLYKKSSCGGKEYYKSLDGFVKLYSRKRMYTIRVWKEYVQLLEEMKKRPNELDISLGIDTTYLTEAILDLEKFCKYLERLQYKL